MLESDNHRFEDILYEIAKICNEVKEMEKAHGYEFKPEPLKRTFGEITSGEDFQKRCVNRKKGCAIGLLAAHTIIDYEKKNSEEHV